ncbi:MAG: hypothetical protein R3D67_17550 [Hyphomicrobiaceae bacterium]
MGVLTLEAPLGWLAWLSAAGFGAGVLVGIKFRAPMLLAASLAVAVVGLAFSISPYDGLLSIALGLLLPVVMLQAGYLLGALLVETCGSDAKRRDDNFDVKLP